MKKPVVDYRQFRLSRINEPQYRHLWFLMIWVVYLIAYFLTENLIPHEKCHVIHGALDDIIPFCEYFAVFYVFWYILLIGALLHYLLYDPESFKKLSLFIFITQIGAMIVYIVYPNIQLLRPETFPRENFFTWMMGIIYSFDTPTGVCPSLHVAYSVGIASVCVKDRQATKRWKIFIVFMAVMISLSVMFVKQHSSVDVFWAIPLSILAEILTFHVVFRKRS